MYGKHRALACVLLLVMCWVACSTAAADGDPAQLRGWNAGEGYQYIQFGRYQQDFSAEPIVWRVLSVNDGKAFLMSERILDARLFDEDSNDWPSSDLYQWLNGSFLKSAFDDGERAALVFAQDIGYVCIPARGDLRNAAYGFQTDLEASDPNRQGYSTPNAINNGVWIDDDGGSSYYLRSTPNKKNVDQIRSDGSLGIARVNRSTVGVRPMIVVDTAKATFQFVDSAGQ